MAGHSPAEVEAVRAELQRLGYLSHRVERYLLQDALRPERVWGTVTLLAAKVGLLGGALAALGGALSLLAWNPPLADAPLDLVVLVLHLLPVSAVVVGLGFLVLAGVLAAVLRFRPGARIDSLSLGVGIVGGLGVLVVVAWRGSELLAPLPPLQAALLAAGGAAAAYLLGRLLYQGLLALAIRLTDRAPRRRLLVGRYLLPAVAVVALVLLALPAVLAARRAREPAAAFLPTVPGERALLIGIDGVLPDEVDYLLKRGALPAFGELIGDGGVALRYDRDPEAAPAAFWTSVATGLPSAMHGVAAVDSFRPAGMETALATNGPFRAYWAHVGRPLGLARQQPLLSNRRSAFTFWELIGRGGAAVDVVNWWGTYPAGRLPGLVVAHGGYQLLADEAAGAVAPEARVVELAEMRRGAVTAEDEPALAVADAALPVKAAVMLGERALLPDRFYRLAFMGEMAQRPRAAALYLPALDLAADGWGGGEVAFADLLAAELGAADRMLRELLAQGDWGTVVVVLDPGRRGGGEGRALLWRRGGCGPARNGGAAAAVERGGAAHDAAAANGEDGAGASRMATEPLPDVLPEELAAALFRTVGLPQSAELPEPRFCRWPAAPARVSGYGRRDVDAEAAAASDEYLKNLRSLGYV